MKQNNNKYQIEYRWNDKQFLTHTKMVEFIKKFGDLTPEPMSEIYDLDEYADKWLKNADFLFAVDQEKIVGFRAIYTNTQITKSAHGLLLSVLPEYQGLGIGRQMYLQTIEFAKQKGMERIYILVHYENSRALNLFTSLGFEVVKTEIPKIELCLEFAQFS
jgi:ribosomal protein S18 acetylase RimI-like enzyme